MERIPHGWDRFWLTENGHKGDKALHALVPHTGDGGAYLMLYGGRGNCIWREDQHQPITGTQPLINACQEIAMLNIAHIDPDLEPGGAQVSDKPLSKLILHNSGNRRPLIDIVCGHFAWK
jgi:hypothetical protein